MGRRENASVALSVLLVFLLLAAPALAPAVEDRTPASVDDSNSGHCGDDGGTCTASDAGTPDAASWVGAMQDWCGNWWCADADADERMDTNAGAIPDAELSAIRFHESGRDCTHGSCNGFVATSTFWDWVSTWSGDIYTINVGDGANYGGNVYADLCTTNAACTPYNSAGNVIRYRFFDSADGGDEDGANIDYLVMRVEGDLNHPGRSYCSTSSGPACPDGGGGWHTANFVATLNANDDGTSGGSSSGVNMEWCLDGDGTPDCTPNVNGASWGSCTAPCGPTISTEDDWYIRYRAVDKAGNTEIPQANFTPDDNGFIRNWVRLGDFAEATSCPTFNADPLNTADNYNRRPGYSELGGTWTAWNDSDALITNPANATRSFAYFLAYVWSDAAWTGQAREGSDDTMKVWVNGGSIAGLTDSSCTAVAVDQQTATITLNAGWNTIIVRNGNQGGGGWEFYFRLVDNIDATYGCNAGQNCFPNRNVAISQYDGGGASNLYPVVHQSFVGLDKTAPTSATNGWFENPESNYLYISGTTLYFSAGMGTSTIRAGISGTATDPVVTGTPSGLASVVYSSEFGDLPVNNGTLSAWTTGNGANQGYGISNVDTDAGTPATVTISDVAGNQLILNYPYVRDVTAPSTACTSAPSQAACDANWVNADTTVTLTCSDTQSGCNSTRNPLYCVATSPGGCTPNLDYTSPMLFTCAANNVCVRYLRWNSSDNVANAEGVVERAIQIDKITPFARGPVGDQGWFNDSQSVGLQCVDVYGTNTSTASGCSAGRPLWCTDTTNSCTPATTYSGPVSVSCAAGSVCDPLYLRYNSSDAAGNYESVQSARYHIDRQLPTVTVNGPANNSWFRRNFAAAITDSDGTGSGLTPLARGNLSAWWMFNESAGPTVADSSPDVDGNNVGYFSGPRVTWNASGWMGAAANFSTPPSNNLDNVSISDFGTFNAFTVSAWAYRIGDTGTLESIVSYKNGGVAPSCGFSLRLNDAAGNHYPRIWVNNGSWGPYAEQQTTVPVNTWVHLAATYNNSYIRLYRNGSLVASAAAGGSSFPWQNYGAMAQCTQNTSIGNEPKWYPGNNWIFPGLIDDVRIYSSALGPDEIWAIYNVTGTYRNETQCYYTTETSVLGTIYTTTQPYTGRGCPSGDPNIGVWSSTAAEGGTYQFGEDCRNSGAPAGAPQNRCRAGFRAIDSVGNSTTAWGAWSLDWDGPFVNLTPPSLSWQTANFAAAGPETDQPPGGVSSGLNQCVLRIVDLPSGGAGFWSVVNWSTYPCGADPTIPVGASGCTSLADNATWPNHTPTCLVATGASDALNPPNTDRNPSMFYYPMDDNAGGVATDLGPLLVNGTLVGGTTWASNGGYLRHGIDFDGSSGRIQANLPAGLTGGPLTNFTVEFWVKPDSGATANRGLFSFCDPAGCSAHDRHIYTDASSRLCMRIWPHESTGVCAAGNALTTDWNHVVLRVQNGSDATLFRNGTSAATDSLANHSDFDWATVMFIGYSVDASSPYFSGVMDEVKVHFRPLNNTEVLWAAQGGEVGGAIHYRVDYTVPDTWWVAPPNLSNQTSAFPINISDYDNQSGLASCQFKVEVWSGGSWILSQDWALRTCNDSYSTNITVGGGQMCYVNNTWCRVFVRSLNNAGLYGPNSTGDKRQFWVIFFQPNVRIEAPAGVQSVGLYTNASEVCAGTVNDTPTGGGDCQLWWYRRLIERGFSVVNLTKTDIQNSINNYGAVLNPYGERFPGLGSGSPDSMTGTIRGYIAGGGFWLESGGYSFWDPGTGSTGAGHSQQLCLSIGNYSTSIRTQRRNTTNETAFPHSPNTTFTSPANLNRPSLSTVGCTGDPATRAIYTNGTTGFSPALHCYGKGCILRTDNTSPSSTYALSNYSIADIYADTLRYWLGYNFTYMVEDDVNIWPDTCTYSVVSNGVKTVNNASRGCDRDANITLGPSLNCRDEGADMCQVWINASNATGSTTIPRLHGIDWTPPSASVSFTDSSICTYAPNNTWIFYSNNSSSCPGGGSFTVNSGATDATSGVARVEFPLATSPAFNTIDPGPHDWAYTFSNAANQFDGWRGLHAFDKASNPFPSTHLLEGWWRLNETGFETWDNSGNGRNGTPTGGPSLGGGKTPGTFGNAFSFAGANRSVRLPDFGQFTNFTVSAWVYRNSSNTVGETVVSYKEVNGGGAGNCGFNLTVNADNANQYPGIRAYIGGAWRTATQSVAIPLTTWTHLAASYDGTDLRLYRNGDLAATTTFSGSMAQCSAPSAIGNRAGLTNNVFPGVIDDVKIWSRTLTAQEINNSNDIQTDESGIGVFRVYFDYTLPAGNTGAAYYSGYYGSLGVPVTLPTVTDNESRLASITLNPPLGRLLMRRDAPLFNGVCNDFADNWTEIPPGGDAPVPPAGGVYNDTSVSQAMCYQYSYNVSDNVANWANVTPGGIAMIDITPADYCGPLGIVANNSYGYVTGTTMYYNGNFSGGFNVTVGIASDAQSGIANVTFPTTTSVGGVKIPPGGGPPFNWSYNWTSSSSFNASTNASCYNGAGVRNNTSFAVYNDKYAPTGNTGPVYADKFYPDLNVTMDIPTVSDNMSGVAAAGAILYRRDTVLYGGTCNGFGTNWTIIAYSPSSPYTDGTVSTGNCYQYSYNISDNVQNWANATSTSIARIDTSPPQTAFIDQPPGNFLSPPITPITYDTGTDPESGIGNWYLQRSNSSMDCAGAPLGWSEYGNVSVGFGQSSGTLGDSFNLIPNTAYRYQLLVENLAGVSANFTDLAGDISYYRRNVDPNVTKQLDLYEWSATYTGASPVDRWAFHNQTSASNDGFTVTQTGTAIEVWRNGTTTFSGLGAASGETHTYKVAHDYACGSGNFTYIYRDGLYVGRVGGPGMAPGDVVRHVASINTQTNWFIAAPGRWDPPLNFDSSATAANGCTNYVLDSCRISGARPCIGDRAVQVVQVLDATVYRPQATVNVTASFACSGTTDFGIAYNSGNGTGWFTQNQVNWFRNDQVSCVSLSPQFSNGGNPGIHRVRAAIRDGSEGSSPFTCGTWDGDNDDVAFWVAEPVRG